MRSLSMETKRRIIEFVNEFYHENGFSPTITVIASKLGFALGTIHKYLHRMSDDGEISFDGRHILTDYIMSVNENISAPISGDIACGTPLYAEQRIGESVTLPKSIFGSGEFFLLSAKGNSMINIGVEDGDHVIIRRQNEAEDGDVVVALIDDSATLKTLNIDRKNRKIILISENDDKINYPDRIYDSVVIQGVYVGVIKKA